MLSSLTGRFRAWGLGYRFKTLNPKPLHLIKPSLYVLFHPMGPQGGPLLRCFCSAGASRQLAKPPSSSSSSSSSRGNARLSLFYPDVVSLTSSQEVLHFALKLQRSYLFNKNDLLLLLQQLALLQQVRSSSSLFRRFWDRTIPAILLHKRDSCLLRLCFLKLADAKCPNAVFDLVNPKP